jgi:hypothetical protein
MGPFEEHLREAIALNRLRAPLYAEATGGASTAISRMLISSEILLLPFARWVDGRAEPFHRHGVPVLHDIFEPMSKLPPFVLKRPSASGVEIRAVPRFRGAATRRDALRALAGGGIPAAEAVLQRDLEAIAPFPGVLCMTRHLLESAIRICAVAPSHVESTLRAGLPSPLRIHRLLLRSHLIGLEFGMLLDRRATPIQQAGVAIICQDVPSIPRLPDRPADRQAIAEAAAVESEARPLR